MSIAVALLVVGGSVFFALLGSSASIASLGLLLVALGAWLAGLLAATLAYGFSTMHYRLEPGTLIIRWLWEREVVPYEAIDAVYAGNRLGRAFGPKPLNVLGYRVGSGWARGIGPVRYYTTSQREEDLSLVVVGERAYVLTPVDAAAFRRALVARIEAGAGSVTLPSSRPWWAPFQALRGGLALGSIGLALLALGMALGLILDRYAALPEVLALQFDSAGQPGLLAPRTHLFWLPGIGALLLGGNTLLGCWLARSERLLANLLWLTSPLVQVMVMVSALRLTS